MVQCTVPGITQKQKYIHFKFQKVVTVYSATINFTASQNTEGQQGLTLFAVWARTFGWDLLFITVPFISSLLVHFIYVLVVEIPKIKKKKKKNTTETSQAMSWFVVCPSVITTHKSESGWPTIKLRRPPKAKDTAVHSSFDPTNSHRETTALV